MPEILTQPLQPEYLTSEALADPDLQLRVRRAERAVLACYDGGAALQGFDGEEPELMDALRAVIALIVERGIENGGAIKSFSQGDRSVTYRDTYSQITTAVMKTLARFDKRSTPTSLFY